MIFVTTPLQGRLSGAKRVDRIQMRQHQNSRCIQGMIPLSPGNKDVTKIVLSRRPFDSRAQRFHLRLD